MESDHPIIDWNQYFRDMAVSDFINNPAQTGWPWPIVEIDGRLFSRRKCNRWRILPEHWVSERYDAGKKKIFSSPIPHHTFNQTWNRNLDQHGGVYNGITTQNFQYDVVNHQYNFFNPNIGVTTSHVEAMQRWAKVKLKSIFSPANGDLIADYLATLMWNKRFKDHFYFLLCTQVLNYTIYELCRKNTYFFKSTDLFKEVFFKSHKFVIRIFWMAEG